MPNRKLSVLLCAWMAVGLAVPVGAADFHVPKSFEFSGMWRIPPPKKPKRMIELSGPGWYRSFWNYDIMSGRDWLWIEPAEPFAEVSDDGLGVILNYTASFHHVCGYYNIPDQAQSHLASLCARQGLDFWGPASLEYRLPSQHFSFEFRGDLRDPPPPWDFWSAVLLEAGVSGMTDDCTVRYLFQNDDGTEMSVGMRRSGELLSGLGGASPSCGSPLEEAWESIFAGGGYIVCQDLRFTRYPGMPEDFRGDLEGTVKTASGDPLIDQARVLLIQQNGSLVTPDPNQVEVLSYLTERTHTAVRSTEVDENGYFKFEDIPLIANYNSPGGPALGLIGAQYSLYVSSPSAAVSTAVVPNGRLHYAGTFQSNLELSDSPVELIVEQIDSLARKEHLIARLCHLSATNYCPIEEGPSDYNTARSFIEHLTDPDHIATDAEMEGLGRGAWAEQALRNGADLAWEHIGMGLRALGMLFANVLDDANLDGAKITGPAKFRVRGVTPSDPASISRRFGLESGDSQVFSRLAGRLSDQRLMCSLFSNLKKVIKGFRAGVIDLAVAMNSDAPQSEVQRVADGVQFMANTVLDFLSARALGHRGAYGYKEVLKLAVREIPIAFRPLYFDNQIEIPWIGANINVDLAPSYAKWTAPLLQTGVDKMVAWDSYDPAADQVDTTEAGRLILEMDEWGTTITKAWIYAVELVEATADSAEAVFDLLGKVHGYFAAAAKVMKVVKYLSDFSAIVGPLAFTYFYLPWKVEQAVYASYGETPPEKGPVARRPRAPGGKGILKGLTLDEINTAFAAASSVLDTLRGHLDGDQLGEALRLVEGGDYTGPMDAAGSLAKLGSELALAVAYGPDPAPAGWTGTLGETAGLDLQLMAARYDMETRLLDLIGNAFNGDYPENDPRYPAERLRVRAATWDLSDALEKVRAALEDVQPDLADAYASLPPVVAVEQASVASQVTGSALATEAGEEFTLQARVHNLGAAAVSGVELSLQVLPAEGATVLSEAVVVPGTGTLEPDDGDPAGGADQAMVEWQLRYEEDLSGALPVLVRILLQESGGEPVTFLPMEGAAMLRADEAVFDQDLDGMPDSCETDLGLDPSQDDSLEDLDQDGLPNWEELQRGTDPSVADSDGDGLSDGEEMSAGADGFATDPLVADTDGDGTPDGQDQSPLDETSVETGAVPEEPVVAVDTQEVILRADRRIGVVQISNAGGGFLRWTTRIENDAVANLGGPSGDDVATGMALILMAPAGMDFDLCDGLETRVHVIDAKGMTRDEQVVTVRIEGAGTEEDGGVDGSTDAGTDGGAADAGGDAGGDSPATDAGGDSAQPESKDNGCGCGTRQPAGGLAWLMLLAVMLIGRRFGFLSRYDGWNQRDDDE